MWSWDGAFRGRWRNVGKERAQGEERGKVTSGREREEGGEVKRGDPKPSETGAVFSEAAQPN